MKAVCLLSIASMLLFFVSCRKENLNETADGDVHLSVYEEISETGERNMQFRLKTANIYPCINYALDMSSTLKGAGMQATIKGVIEPGICLTAIGPATGLIDWGQPKNGSYPLNFEIFGQSNTGVLTVDEQGYRIDIDQRNNLVLDTEELFKIPPGVIWGTVGYASTSLGPTVDRFFEELEMLGATKLELPQGHYGYFDVTETGEMAVPELHGYHHVKMVLFGFSGNENELQQLVREYGDGDQTTVYISIYSDKGSHIFSWVK